MHLYFHPQGFPRNITRDEWRRIWRWKRVTTKQLRDQEQERIRFLKQPMPEQMRMDIIDRMVYPPLLVHDKQRLV